MKIENKLFFKKINVPSNNSKKISIIDLNQNDFNFNLEINLNENSEISLNFASLSYNSNKEINIIVNHLFSNSKSECNVFSLAKNNGQVKINLLGNISKGYENNLCKQSIDGIVLSNDSSIIGSPNLMIDTNSIKAIHSLKIGRINESKLFYLMSKGLTKKNSIFILIISYYNLVLNSFSNNKLKDKIINKIKDKI